MHKHDKLTSGQAAKLYGVSRQTIYNWRDDYGIGEYIYEHWVFTRTELDYASKQADGVKSGRPRSDEPSER